jgi:16S rRNA (guanine527-N7)-methyltransferase
LNHIKYSQDNLGLVLRLGERVNVDLNERQAESLVKYSQLAIEWNKIANLTGANSVESYITGHVIDCLAVVPFLSQGPLVDIGSGAGLPGIVLAIADPERYIALVEPRGKRSRFLQHIKMQLGLRMIDINSQPVEQYNPSRSFRYVISRAFGPLNKFVEKSIHLVGSQTEVVAMKSRIKLSELSEAEALLGPARCVEVSVPSYDSRTLVFMKKT